MGDLRGHSGDSSGGAFGEREALGGSRTAQTILQEQPSYNTDWVSLGDLCGALGPAPGGSLG